MLMLFACALVYEKKRNEKSVIINVCCVVDDFVTTSVANGLRTQNNGLLTDMEMA